MKHKLKNISNRPMPVDGTDLKPVPGEVVEVEITRRLKNMIKNKFFEDLGIVEEEALGEVEEAVKNIDEEQEDFFPKNEAEEEEQKKAIEDYMPRKPRKKRVKKIKKRREVKTSEVW